MCRRRAPPCLEVGTGVRLPALCAGKRLVQEQRSGSTGRLGTCSSPGVSPTLATQGWMRSPQKEQQPTAALQQPLCVPQPAWPWPLLEGHTQGGRREKGTLWEQRMALAETTNSLVISVKLNSADQSVQTEPPATG